MSEHQVGKIEGLPENAYTELKPGEEYKPLMPANSNPQEITVYSVTMGSADGSIVLCRGCLSSD